MAVDGDSAIWRDNTETAATDKLEFNDNAVINTDGNIMNTGITIDVGIARNERPGEIDKLQDTGPSGVTITVTGTISDPEGDDSTAHKFKTWALENKTVDVTFPKGRFGLRLNDFPSFNLTPTKDRGYMLESINFIRDGITKGKLSFIAVLRFNGSPSAVSPETGIPDGNGEYNW